MRWAHVTVFLFAMSLFSRLFGAPSAAEQRKAKIQEHEAQQPTAEALERRAQSIASLQQRGVRTMAPLPVIEDLKSARIRTPRERAERLVGCTICAVGGETGDQDFVRELLRDFNADRLLSPKESEFVAQNLADQHERVQFSWRYERSWVLLWALGYVERLDFPTKQCDVPWLAGFVRNKSVEQLVREAKPRSAKELLDEADFIYRLHWAVVDERVNGEPGVPAEVEKGVVLERHAALNWLIGYMGQAWDEITTDT
jgi:hypothetical protein